MKRIVILVLSILAISMSSCYSVSQIGNCKYYTPKNLSTYGRSHHPVEF